MPADLESCVQQVLEKQPDLDESNAYAICQNAIGSVRDISKTGQLATFEDNGRLYVKAFLLDSSVNINEWGVTAASLRKNINTFIGKPLVLTEQFDHPLPKEHDSLAHWLAYQESFRIGTIIDVVPRDGTYYAIIEVTNPDAKKAFEQGHIPTYVSPAIAQDVDDPGAPQAMSNWEGVHLAIVDEPAYTVKKAIINGSCGGDSKQCLLQLRAAKVKKDGLSCGFCNYKILAGKFSSQSASDTKHKSAKLTDTTLNVNKEGNAQTNQAQAPKEETVPKTEYVALEKKLADAELKVRELSETNQSISAQVAEIQLERRRDKIERIVTAELIKDEKKRSEKVNSLVGSSIPISEIEDLYKDAVIVKNFKPATAAAAVKQHVQLGSNNNEHDEQFYDEARRLAMMVGLS